MAGKQRAICKAFDELTSDSWGRRDGGWVAALLSTLWFDSFWLHWVTAASGPAREKVAKQQNNGTAFLCWKIILKDLQEAPVGSVSWYLIWGVRSSWCQNRTLYSHYWLAGGAAYSLTFLSVPRKKSWGYLHANSSVCRGSLGFSSFPTHFSQKLSEGWTISHSRYSGN
jgi:hypothetical protein